MAFCVSLIARAGYRCSRGLCLAQVSLVTRAARILLVDDDPLLQKSLTLFFMTQGYDVDGATTAQAAFKAIERHRPDLIVLDLGLPDLDGLEACRRVRQAS